MMHIVNSANSNMVQARAGIESWFNASMERVSAEYKKKMQLLTLLVAFSISLVIGVDSLGLANSLWREPVIRAVLSGSAQHRLRTKVHRAEREGTRVVNGFASMKGIGAPCSE